MSPTSPDNQPGFELPQPNLGSGLPMESTPLPAERQSQAAELPGTNLSAPTPATPTPMAAVPVPLGAIPVDPVPAVSTSSLQVDSPAIADDADLIEKEWVDKAKAIVEQTRDDPHEQNKKLNEFKADYMKKRYSKEIRLDEE